ncbi:ferritin-like domain-containing protein [Hymenobacter sp. GOD-10R]|uniref:ferritin-like domain-containing protein n=1 Tax=Hymenobacter sp. GOD-10R TaxID=3093922 RepID=UPI002D7789ED|nr:ferritin-like domain-containing protein [Hymenobacter sp. GOD-10R]WRQ29544.1 ferritin-like domain-containing protein [Hymenobacter sp. GOD-10R]
MDLFKILSDIEKVDPEVYERFDTRRRAFKYISGMGKAVTAATLPGLLSTMFNKAYGQTSTLAPEIVATLNLALQLEYLERYYYQRGLDTPGLIPSADVPAITIIRDDEVGHIAAIRAVLGTQAFGPDPGATAFDYTAGGKVNPFANAANFYAVSQAFVDTGVRAYKGGAVNLMGNKDILTAALNIHSVEARHSSHIRLLRRGGVSATADVNNLVAKPKSWISGTDGGGSNPPLTTPVYGAGVNPPPAGTPTGVTFPAEDNTTQGAVNVQTGTTFPTIPGVTLTTAQQLAAATEAFDEPLDATTVKTIARNFRSTVGATLGLFN